MRPILAYLIVVAQVANRESSSLLQLLRRARVWLQPRDKRVEHALPQNVLHEERVVVRQHSQRPARHDLYLRSVTLTTHNLEERG